MNETSAQLILPLAPADRRVKRRGIAVFVCEMSPLTCCGYFWPPGVASLHCIQQVSPFRSVPSSLTVAELPPAASSPHQLGVTGRGLRPTIPPPCSRSLRRRRTFSSAAGEGKKNKESERKIEISKAGKETQIAEKFDLACGRWSFGGGSELQRDFLTIDLNVI